MAESKSLLQPVDDATRALARRLVRSARFGALGVVDAKSGWPQVTRIALASDLDGSPVLLVSALSSHTQALHQQGRCSLLLGEPGSGDPLAYPRISLQARAVAVLPDDPARPRVRRRYLSRLPKAALYADFADFSFWRIEPIAASLNGGFGRAFELLADDVLTPLDDWTGWNEVDESACDHMNSDHAQAVQDLAHGLGRATGTDWRMATLDPQGLELAQGDAMLRLEFLQQAASPQEVHGCLMALLEQARSKGP